MSWRQRREEGGKQEGGKEGRGERKMIEYSSARSYLHLSLKEKNVLFWGLYDSVSILNWNKKSFFPPIKIN